MDKIKKYRQIISEMLARLASHKSGTGIIDEYAICDEKTDNYILFNVGWHNNGRRQFGYPVHIRIKDGKVLVEWDGTNLTLVDRLIEAGIDEIDIVWNFEKPEKLKYQNLKAA